ncbi:MAG: DUF2520 domain-containing protein [Bacteroidales bacterium]|jgi:predicted short-subunit dehydrogenase-like oxidoreductase (DUF2520 family)|nr:DUF2520 domain-containing protein [Bacteroidales bacterium]
MTEKICLIGSGNVGTNLGINLKQKGIKVAQVISRNTDNARDLAIKLDAKYSIEISDFDRSCTIIIFSVSDDAIKPLLQSVNFENRLLIHTAGSVSVDIFSDYSDFFGVLYPLQSFKKADFTDFSDVPLFIEGNRAESYQRIQSIASQLSNKVYHADSEMRLQIHVAAVFACNFTNHLYQISHDLIKDMPIGFEVFAPLIRKTAEQAIKKGNPAKTQTGPAVRNDKGSMGKHLQQLKQNESLVELYKFMSNRIFETKKMDTDE